MVSLFSVGHNNNYLDKQASVLEKSTRFKFFQHVIHRHYIHRLSLPAHAAGKICTVVNLGLATAELVQPSWISCFL